MDGGIVPFFLFWVLGLELSVSFDICTLLAGQLLTNVVGKFLLKLFFVVSEFHKLFVKHLWELIVFC